MLQGTHVIAGDISDVIYDTGCWFADPTVQFSGLAKWKSNLKLLVPFLIDPQIQLTKLECQQQQQKQQAPLLQVVEVLCTVESIVYKFTAVHEVHTKQR